MNVLLVAPAKLNAQKTQSPWAMSTMKLTLTNAKIMRLVLRSAQWMPYPK